MKAAQRGYTLVELVLVLMLLALLASLGATFVGRIVAGQQATRSRLVLAQAADAALGRVAYELARALPNSVRVTSNAEGTWIEWVPVLDAGRWRQAPDTVSAQAGDVYTPGDGSDGSFDVIGPALAAAPAGAQIAWANLGTPESDVYLGNNRRAGLAIGNAGRSVSFTATGTALPDDAGGARFHVVGTPVTLACRGTAGAMELRRYSGYGWLAAQPVAAATLAGGSSALLLDGLAGCSAAYGTALANIGLLNLRIGVQDAETGTRMELLQQLAVDNTP